MQGKDDALTKVLVISGNASRGPLLQKVFEKVGQSVVFAKPESSSLTSSDQHEPSLVITDLLEANSDDSLKTLHQVHQVAPHAKIIALFSGGEGNQTNRQFLAEQPGVFRVVNNPFDVGDLLEAMRKAMDVSHQPLLPPT